MSEPTQAQPAAAGAAPPLRQPVYRVSQRAIAWWRVRALISWVGVLLLTTVTVLAVPDPPAVVGPVLIVLVALATVHIAVMPSWRYQVHRWEVTGDAVYTQAGWLNQEWRVAPMSRIQTVDTQRGPLQQLFKLATVTVTTASAAGPLHIDGLDERLAGELVEQLTATAQITPGDAT